MPRKPYRRYANKIMDLEIEIHEMQDDLFAMGKRARNPDNKNSLFLAYDYLETAAGYLRDARKDLE